MSVPTHPFAQTGECDPVQQGRVSVMEDQYNEPMFRPPPGCTPSRGQSNTNSAQARPQRDTSPQLPCLCRATLQLLRRRSQTHSIWRALVMPESCHF